MRRAAAAPRLHQLPSLARGVYHVRPRPDAPWETVVVYDGGGHWLAEAQCLPALAAYLTAAMVDLLDAVDGPPAGAGPTGVIRSGPSAEGWYQFPARPAHERVVLCEPLPDDPGTPAAVLLLSYAPQAAAWVARWRETARPAVQNVLSAHEARGRTPGVHWLPAAVPGYRRCRAVAPDGRLMWDTTMHGALVDAEVRAELQVDYQRMRGRMPTLRPRVRLLRP
jgi:hypothetical protein